MTIASRFNEISRVLLAFLGLNLALLVTSLPWVWFVLFTDDVAGLGAPAVVGVGVGTFALAIPGVVAAFAACRDAQVLRPDSTVQRLDETATAARKSGSIAPPYWTTGESSQILRPYFRNYVLLFWRALAVAARFALVLGVALIGALLAMRAPEPASLVGSGLLLAAACYSLIALMVSGAMVVEFPNAKPGAVFRKSFLLAAARWPQSLGVLVLLSVFGWALLQWPVLMLLAANSLLVFFGYHLAAAIIAPVRVQLIAEETNSADGYDPSSSSRR